MAICDANYIRILKLLPGFGPNVTREIVLSAPGPLLGKFCGQLVIFEVLELLRYTSTISIRMAQIGITPYFYRPPLMLVRLYHDASTAEVVSYQEQGAFHLRSQPGEGPQFSVDEKQQVNAFLAEWLVLCLEHGLGNGSSSEQNPDVEKLIPWV
jgi:uncharacterized protein